MKTISLALFYKHYHEVLKPKGVRLGQALATTFTKVGTEDHDALASMETEADAVGLFNDLSHRYMWFGDYKVVDSACLDVK